MADESHEANETKCLRIFGGEFDNELKIGTHISNVSKTMGQRKGALSRSRNRMLTIVKLAIYKTAILPHMAKCSTFWHFCKAADKRLIEKPQEKARRLFIVTHPHHIQIH